MPRARPTPAAQVARLQPVVGLEHLRGEVRRHRQVVEVALLEREQARIALLDDADLDAAGERQLLSGEPGDDRAIGRVAARRKRHVAKIRVRLEHDLLRAPPLLDPVGPGADGIGHHPAARVAVGLDHLARDRAGGGGREVGQQVVRRRGEPDPDRVAVDRLQAFERRIVVEAAGLPGLGDQLRRRRRTCRRTAAATASASAGRARASTNRRSRRR